MGYDAFNRIGGPDFNDKELVILENSAHAGHVEKQELFLALLLNFVHQL
jgi:pimeloyl-ACP methyl ester carboxylesterase